MANLKSQQPADSKLASLADDLEQRSEHRVMWSNDFKAFTFECEVKSG